jgi:hypothetical protein
MWWKGPLIAATLSFFYGQAKISRASRSGSALLFRVSLLLQIFFGVGISTLVIVFVVDKEPRELWLNALGMAIILAMCLGWPSTITVDQSGVTSKVWWRRKAKISWDTIVDLEKNVAGDMKIYGSDGTIIGFSRYHVDPDRFEAEILRRAKLRRSTRADAPVSIKLTGK